MGRKCYDCNRDLRADEIARYTAGTAYMECNDCDALYLKTQIAALKTGIKQVISEYGIGDALLETTREAEIIRALEALLKERS